MLLTQSRLEANVGPLWGFGRLFYRKFSIKGAGRVSNEMRAFSASRGFLQNENRSIFG